MSDALPLIRSHLAAGEGWTLSWAIDAGAPRLVVILAGAELATARQWLAVAGSVAGRHLAEAVEVVALGDGSVAAVFAAPAGPSLAELLRRRDTLTGGELVTLLAPLAETLAGLHARGLAPAAITAETVWLADDGRPLLVPVGFLEHPDADAGLLALVDLGRSALDRSSRVASRLATALDAAADGRLDAGGLAAVLLRATPAVPVRRAARAAEAQRRPWRSHGRGVIAIALSVAVAIGIGAASSRRDGSGTVLAAPAAPVVGGPSASPTSWLSVMADLERARARAYATGDPAMLDEVYAPGSPQGDADRTQLRRLAR
ncbi:MAG TPA: hypothetical protein VFH66_00760, partial [Mycobacteriales bacterium]|nr:hypothetical protein [Mycobacteriales bacterium]